MEENLLHASYLPYGMMINTQKVWDPQSSAEAVVPVWRFAVQILAYFVAAEGGSLVMPAPEAAHIQTPQTFYMMFYGPYKNALWKNCLSSILFLVGHIYRLIWLDY